MIYLSGVSAFLKYDGIRFTHYPYIFARGDTQLFVVTTKLRTGPNGTVWVATDQCCEVPTGYDFQYFEALGRSSNVGISGLVTTTHFGAGIVSFTQAHDGNVWADIECAPPVCGANSFVTILNAAFQQAPGPQIPLGDTLGEMTSGPDGAVYAIDYTPTSSTVKIVRMDVTTKRITRSYALPATFATGTISDLTSGPDGALWFTARNANRIGRLRLNGTFTSYRVPTANAGLGGIAAASDNALWFTETNANKIGRVALDGTMKEYPIPTRAAGPIGITAGAPSCTPATIYFTETSALGILTF